MPTLPGMKGDVYFGEASDRLPDWRQTLEPEGNEDILSPEERAALVGMLGFDPADITDDAEEAERAAERYAKAAAVRDLAALASEAGVDISGIDPEQLRQGMAVEREHNRGDTDVVQSDADLLKIAVAHLRESPDYYRALAEMEKSLQKYAKAWSEKDHPRGQPENKGQFVEKGEATANLTGEDSVTERMGMSPRDPTGGADRSSRNAGKKPMRDATAIGGKPYFRLSSIGGVVPTSWSYGDDDEAEVYEGAQVWTALDRAVFNLVSDTDDGSYRLEDGYEHFLILNAAHVSSSAGGNFWASAEKSDTKGVWSVASADLVDWLKEVSGAWDGEDWDITGLRRWLYDNEENVAAWLDDNVVEIKPEWSDTLEESSSLDYARWDESAHPRGQPGNPGQFAEKEGSTSPQADTGPGLFDEPPAEKPKAEKKPRKNAKKTLSQKLGLDQPLPQTPDLPELPEAEPVGAVKPRKPWWDLGHSLEQATHLREGVKQLAALRPVLDRFNEQYGAVQDALIDARSAAGVVKNLDRKDAPAKERQEAETLAVERLEQVKKIWEEVKGHKESLDRRVREHLQAVFGVDDPLVIKTGTTNVGSLSGPWEQQFRDNIDTALAFLQPFVGKQEAPESLPPVNFVMKQERANYKDSEKTVSVNFFKDDMGTIVHEIAHSIEFNISAVMGQCQDFLKERVGDAEYRKINDIIGVKAYRDDEIGAEDDFTKAFGQRASYVGKKYPFEATEILSMGMEQLYRDPVGFAEKDPEYVAFLMGVLRGDLR